MEKLKNTLKSRRFKIFFLILVLGLSLFEYSETRKEEVPEQRVVEGQISPTPTLAFLERQAIKQRVVEGLPVITEEYTIEYFPSDDTFVVQITKNPYSKYQEDVRLWFKQRGLDPDTIEIHWTSVRGVY